MRKTRFDRFYANPVLRDNEWNRATQPAWSLMATTIVIVSIAFIFGVYGDGQQRAAGWIIGLLMIGLYLILGRRRRRMARRHLRLLHGQSTI